MSKIKKITILLIFFLGLSTNIFAENKVAYINIDLVLLVYGNKLTTTSEFIK